MNRVAGIRLNSQDIGFLVAMGRYSLLSSEDACDFYVGLKPNSVLRRLRLLAQSGLTNAVKLAVWSATDESLSKCGRIPALHALTDEGARVIEEQTGDRPTRVLRSAPSPATFLHRREIVRVMRAFDVACDKAGLEYPTWVMEHDPWHAAPKAVPLAHRRLLAHEFAKGLSCHPDIACRFRIGSSELVLYWEIDLSTEGRKQIRKAAKTDGYTRLFNEQGWKRYWPDLNTSKRFVIWVAPTQRRIRSLQDALRDQAISPACRFLAATYFSSSESLLTSDIWETVNGERRPMYRPSVA